MKLYHIFIASAVLHSCANSESDQIDSDLNESDTTLEILTSFPDPDSSSLYVNIDYSTKTEEDLNNWLDSNDYIGINDHGYRIFDALYDCKESEEIADDFLNDSRKALYAYYKLTFGECEISSEAAIEWIEKFETSKDTFGIWTFPTMRGEMTLAQEAANAIWKNELFPLDAEQYEYVTRVRGF